MQLVGQCMSSVFGIPETDITFARGENGKPFCPGIPIAFNVSHSRDFIAASFVPNGEATGCDLQADRPGYSQCEIAALQFTREERRLLEERTVPFFLLWAMKESYVKFNAWSVFDMPSFSVLPIADSFDLFSFSSNDCTYYLSIYPAIQSSEIIAPFSLRTEHI